MQYTGNADLPIHSTTLFHNKKPREFMSARFINIILFYEREYTLHGSSASKGLI